MERKQVQHQKKLLEQDIELAEHGNYGQDLEVDKEHAKVLEEHLGLDDQEKRLEELKEQAKLEIAQKAATGTEDAKPNEVE